MEFDAYATRREPMDGLFVQVDTLGRRHSVVMPDGVVTITLPGIEDADRFVISEFMGDIDPRMPISEVDTWMAVARAGPDTTWFEVLSVDLRVDLTEPVRFEGQEGDFNGIGAHSSASAKRSLEATLRAMNGAFDTWTRTLRWLALAPEIAFSDERTQQDGTRHLGFKLFRKSDDALFSGQPENILWLGSGGKVDRQAWATADRALEDAVGPPVWIDFMIEAHRRCWVGDLRGATVNAAIASETAIRDAFQATLPQITSPVAARILDTTPVQGLLARWEEISGWDKRLAKDRGKSQVHELFDLRNAVLHSGLNAPDELAKIRRLLPPATAFILACDADASNRKRSAFVPTPESGALKRLTKDGN